MPEQPNSARVRAGRPAAGAPWLITATPPTPNGDLHIGHLSGPYLAADVFARGRGLHGEASLYVSSSDENQSYVVTSAERNGGDPAGLAAHYHDEILKTLKAARIEPDMYNRPDARHFRRVQAFFQGLHAGGKLVEKEVDALYDLDAGRFLFESYVGGRCPVCLAGTSGSICEACGHPNDPARLIDPHVKGGSRSLETRRLRQLFLPVEAYRDRIAAFYREVKGTWRPHLPQLIDELLADDLADYPVTYPSHWGVPVGLDGWDGHVWNVWAEMLPGLMHSTQLAAEATGLRATGGDWWRDGSGGALVQFLGYDNSYFFAVAHLALSFAADDCALPDPVKPSFIITNEFFRLENRKFSSSRNHAIWGRDLLAHRSADALRFYLALAGPELMETNFVQAEMDDRLQRELLGPWRELGHALDNALQRLGQPEVPAVADSDALSRCAHRIALFQSPERFSLGQQAETILVYLEVITERLRAARQQEDVAAAWREIAALAVFASPIMPDFSAALAAHMDMPRPLAWGAWEPTLPVRSIPDDLLRLDAP